MLKENTDKKIISLNHARSQIPKMKAVFIVKDMSDMSDIKGYISFISDSKDSYSALIHEYHKMQSQHVLAMVIGSYENGGAIGVQYELG